MDIQSIGKEEPIMELDSDSSSQSEQETLDQYIQNNLHKRVNEQHRKKLRNEAIICAVVLLCLIIFILIYYLHTLGVFEQLVRNYNEKKEPNTIIGQPFSPLTDPNTIKIDPKIDLKANNSVPAVNLLDLNSTTISLEGTFFSSNIKDGTNLWYNIQQKNQCIPNMIVNSATKISSDLYAQMTVYDGVSVIRHKVVIPAQNGYYFEPPRQFISNFSAAYPEKTVAFDHYDPLLLVLVIKYCQRGMFVSDRNDWSLQQKNLIFNDLYLLANKQPYEQLLNSNSYELLITSNLDLVVDLLVNKKQQISILIDFTHPVSIKTSFLLKMKVYSLSEGYQCIKRTFSLYEEAMWHINQEAYLIPGWYVFTYSDNDISFGLEYFNYQAPLLKENAKECIPQGQFMGQTSYFRSSKTYFYKIPYGELYIFGKDAKKDKNQYREVYTYLMNRKSKDPVFLSDGPLEYLFITTTALSLNTTIFLDQKYDESKLFLKNLVLNDQERNITSINPQQLSTKDLGLVITASHLIVQTIKAKQYLYLNRDTQEVNPHYQYTQLVENQCYYPKEIQVNNHLIEKGVYLVKLIG